jgi:K+-sensing histidine kinase KdpD
MDRRAAWYVASFVVPVAVGIALVPFRTQLTSANLALIMVVAAVVVAAASNQIGASVACAVVTGFAYDFFLVVPYYSFTIAEPSEALTALLVLAVVATVGTVSSRFRRQRSITERREENLGLLYQLVDQVANAAATSALIETSTREIADLLGAPACTFEARTDVLDGPDTAGSWINQIGEVRKDGELWDTDRSGLPGPTLKLPVQSGGLDYGCFVITPAADQPVERWAIVVTVMIADLVGAALARWPD